MMLQIFIYCGTVEEGYVKEPESILNWLCDDKNESSRAVLPVGKLTLQAWNRGINGEKSEHKRGDIQLKWGKICEELKINPIKRLWNVH